MSGLAKRLHRIADFLLAIEDRGKGNRPFPEEANSLVDDANALRQAAAVLVGAGKAGNTHAETTHRTHDGCGLAMERFPATKLDTGELLHVYQDEAGEWWVWLNTEVTEFDGLCIGYGATRDEAIAAAVRVLECATDALQAPA